MCAVWMASESNRSHRYAFHLNSSFAGAYYNTDGIWFGIPTQYKCQFLANFSSKALSYFTHVKHIEDGIRVCCSLHLFVVCFANDNKSGVIRGVTRWQPFLLDAEPTCWFPRIGRSNLHLPCLWFSAHPVSVRRSSRDFYSRSKK